MRKRVIEFLNELPDFVKKEAVRNYEKDTNDCRFKVVEHPAVALMYAFSWGETPEGFECWSHVYDALACKQSDKEIVARFNMHTKHKCQCGRVLTGDTIICGSCNLDKM